MIDLITFALCKKMVKDLIGTASDFSFKKVDVLPETGEGKYIYLVPKKNASGDDIYDEYIWFEGKFEPIGSMNATGVQSDWAVNDSADPAYVKNKPELVGKKTPEGGEIFNAATSAGENAHAEGVRTAAYGKQAHSEGFAPPDEVSGVLNVIASEIVGTGKNKHTQITISVPKSECKIDTSIDFTSYSEISKIVGINFLNGVFDKHSVFTDGANILNVFDLIVNTPVESETQEMIVKIVEPTTIAIGNYEITVIQQGAIGNSSHSEGGKTIAAGQASHTEGFGSRVLYKTEKGDPIGAHAEGSNTIAMGKGAHSEGGATRAEGKYSHSEGEGTVAIGEAQHVQGSYNIPDDDGDYIHIVGNGQDTKNGTFLSNAHTLDRYGNAWYQSDVMLNGVDMHDSSSVSLKRVAGDVRGFASRKESIDRSIPVNIKSDGSLCVDVEDIKNCLYGEGFSPEILVYAPTGTKVVCSNTSSSMTKESVNGSALFRIDEVGSWTVSASIGGTSVGEEVVDVSMVKRYTVSFGVHIYGARWAGMPGTKWERTDLASGFSDPVPSVGGSVGSSPFDDIAPWSGMRRETRAAGEMVAIPKYWIKVQNYGDGGIWVQIADSPLDGFVCSPGHSDRGDGKGERDVIYVGRYHCGEDWKSTNGVLPKVFVTRPGSNNEIHSVDSNTWLWDWATMWTVKYLYLVEFANWNSQSTIGFGCGDGSGVSNMGYTGYMPYHTGTTMSSRSEYGFSTQYRYIEGLWDNAFDWVGGCYYNEEGLNVIMNPSNYSEDIGGKLVGSLVDGYSSKFKVGNMPWAIVPTESNGDPGNGLSDNWFYSSGSPCLYVGGNYYQSDNRGMFFVSFGSPYDAGDGISARSMELP